MQTDSVANPSARLDWLDSLRGWAVLGVVFVHALQLTHNAGVVGEAARFGQYGVQLFFVISALTISMTYESHLRQFGSSLRSQLGWLIKRICRIAPLYYAAAVFYALEQCLIYRATQHRYGHALNVPSAYAANLFFLHTWVPSANNNVVPGGWSIGVEMFFYLLIPPLYLVRSKQWRMVLLSALVIVLLAISALTSFAINHSFYVEDNTYLYYWFPTQAPVLILGLLFFAMYGAALRSPRVIVGRGKSLLGIVVLLALGAYLGTWGNASPLLAPTVVGAAFVLLVAVLSAGGHWLLVNRPLTFLGKISYSVYICHELVLDVLRAIAQKTGWTRAGAVNLIVIFLIAVAVTSLLAMFTKRLIEDPAIRYGHSLGRRIAEG